VLAWLLEFVRCHLKASIRRSGSGQETHMRFFVTLSRLLLSGILVVGGWDTYRDPEPKVPAANSVVPSLLHQLGLSADTSAVLRANGLVQVGAASALAVGALPRLSSVMLIGSLVPTTLPGHRFWTQDETAARATQRVQFLKNLAIIAGLLVVATEPRSRRKVLSEPA
jgi:uncharacterized membrane protein YphA (DoxX/SURF4 family)